MIKNPRILIYGHYFPNCVESNFGGFIYRNLAHYPQCLDLKIVAPVPFFLNVWRGKSKIRIPYRESRLIGSNYVEIFRPRFILFPKKILNNFIGWIEYVLTLPTVLKIYKRWRFDIIHVNFAHPDGIAAMHISRFIKVPYIITEHQGAIDSFLKIPILKKQILRVYINAAQVIAVSEYTQKCILSHCKTNISIMVIPNGIITNSYILRIRKASPINLVFVGNLIETKGVHILIKAVQVLLLEIPSMTLSIIGDGKYKKKLIKEVQNSQLTKSIRFLGMLSSKTISRTLAEYDILALPSFIESFSIVLIEAMAAGLPVVATKCGGPESIVTNETGVLVNPGSVSELVKGIKIIISNWDKYDPMNIRNCARNHYELSEVVKSYSSLYEQLIQ